MKFYLKIINPIISVLVFFLCVWAACVNEGKVKFLSIFDGGFSTYFLAKGFFTGSILFITGYILLFMLEQKGKFISYLKKEYAVIFSASAIVIGIFLVPYMVENKPFQKKEPEAIVTKNPSGLIIKQSYRIAETEKVKIGGIIKNKDKEGWANINVKAELYSHKHYIDVNSVSVNNLEAGSESGFLIDFPDVINSRTDSSLEVKFSISATPMK